MKVMMGEFVCEYVTRMNL